MPIYMACVIICLKPHGADDLLAFYKTKPHSVNTKFKLRQSLCYMSHPQFNITYTYMYMPSSSMSIYWLGILVWL